MNAPAATRHPITGGTGFTVDRQMFDGMEAVGQPAIPGEVARQNGIRIPGS